jgi:anaerobic selenocysteine-containing dehydrogenase
MVLMAGERRAYNANQIYRSPEWRKTDAEGALRVHPADLQRMGLADGERARCRTSAGALVVTVAADDTLRPGVATLPHGYGQRYAGGSPVGPAINRLTKVSHCDPLSKTPFHKYVPVHIDALAGADASQISEESST